VGRENSPHYYIEKFLFGKGENGTGESRDAAGAA
jgi:hypothetical protein